MKNPNQKENLQSNIEQLKKLPNSNNCNNCNNCNNWKIKHENELPKKNNILLEKNERWFSFLNLS
jgi:hypothetical protein